MNYRILTIPLALVLFVTMAGADWADNFDSYALGSGLNGQGGWACWDNNPAADAFVSDSFALSTPHSAQIISTTDIVQEFSETSGEWTMTGWNYIPGGSTGKQFFILLNTYTVGGPYSWSLDLLFDSDAGMVSVSQGTGTASIINDVWVEIKVEINLDSDSQQIYYNGILLDTIPWSGTGVPEIAALDLFSNGGSTIYWDDCSLVNNTGALEQTTWGHIKASL